MDVLCTSEFFTRASISDPEISERHNDTRAYNYFFYRSKQRASNRDVRNAEGIMVSSAIFGAAAGTGLALVVAMTIVVYRYYAMKRKGKWSWSDLDRWPDPPPNSNSNPEENQPRHHHHCHAPTTSHVLGCWRKPQKSYYAVQTAVSIYSSL